MMVGDKRSSGCRIDGLGRSMCVGLFAIGLGSGGEPRFGGGVPGPVLAASSTGVVAVG